MNRAQAGRDGESAALRYFIDRNYTLMERNFRGPRGEIDLVLRDGDCLIFVEVKSWSKYSEDSIRYAVNGMKRARIIHTATWYLRLHPEFEHAPCRFDVLLVRPGDGSIEHWANAFEGDT